MEGALCRDEDAGATLARAFSTDPVFTWVLPRPEQRLKLDRWFTAMVRWGRQFGQVVTTGPAARPTAVAIWGSRPANIIEHVRAGLLVPTLGFGAGPLLKLLRLGDVLQREHDRLCPGPHRYLYFLGVDPEHQRKGLGSALIRPGLAEADRGGLPCYLETATESNVTFYGRLDFTVALEGEVVRGAPKFWLLKRAARST